MTHYMLWYCLYFSQFTERYMILDWFEAEKLSHISAIEVTNTYLNIIGDQLCFLCFFKDHQHWQWIYPKIARYFPEREDMISMKMFFSNQKSNCWQKKKKNTHWILKPKVWDSSKQDTFWDGRGVSGAFGKYTLFITSWLDNDSSKKKKAFSNQFK